MVNKQETIAKWGVGLNFLLFIRHCLLFIRRAFWQRWLKLKFYLFQRNRHNATTIERIGDLDVIVLPSVMNPVLFLTGKWFVEQLSAETIPPQSTVLDLGCGSGVVGLAAARWAGRVVSADINPSAVRCTTINSYFNQLEHKISVAQSNLFDNLQEQKFDVVLFNPPFYAGSPEQGFDQAWRAEQLNHRLARELRHHLKPNGYALILLSSLGVPEQFISAFLQQQYVVSTVIAEDIGSETLQIYKVQHVVA